LDKDLDLNRRSDRISLSLPIEVLGIGADGQPFDEETRTVLVTRHGGSIILARELEPEAEITVRYHKTHRAARSRVVERSGPFHNGTHYGVEFLDPEMNLWGIHFPTPSEVETAVGRVLLECESCHAQEVACLDGLSLELFQANRQISRACQCSTAMTVWGEVSTGIMTESGDLAGLEIATRVASTAKSRIQGLGETWKVHACIRNGDSREDLVLTGSPTREGVRFFSEHRYGEGEKIEIAIPHQPAGGNVFIPAEIKWTSGEPEDGVTMYGVAYLRRIRKAVRYEAKAELHIGILGVGVRKTGRVVDLSMAGVMMQTSEKLEPGTHVRMGIEVGTDVLRTMAVVRRTLPGVGTAFEFSQMTQRDRQILGRLILQLKIGMRK